jgi:hypothetical protein
LATGASSGPGTQKTGRRAAASAPKTARWLSGEATPGAEGAHDGDRLGVVAFGRLDQGGDRFGGSAGVGGADQARQACHGASAGW